MIIHFDNKSTTTKITGLLTDGAAPGLYLMVWSALITRYDPNNEAPQGSLLIGYTTKNAALVDVNTRMGVVEGVNDVGNRWSGTQVIETVGGEIGWTLEPDQNLEGTDYSGTLRMALVGPI